MPRRLSLTLLCALLLHGVGLLLIALLSNAVLPPKAPGAHTGAEAAEFIVELESTQPGSTVPFGSPGALPARPGLGRPVARARKAVALAPEPETLNGEPSAGESDHAPAGSTAPALSLSQLGVSGLGPEPENPFMLLEKKEPVRRESAEERIERHLAAEALRHDQKLGLGSEGPVLSALSTAAFGVAPLYSTALFSARIDADGRLRFLQLVSPKGKAWQSVADRAFSKLKDRKLRTPGHRSVQLTIEVKSKVSLPSGHSPGTGVSVLGIPVKPKGHPDLAEVALLKPKLNLRMVDVPNPGNPEQSVKLPSLELGLNLLETDADPVDLGASSRQVIQTRLVSQRVL